MALNASQSQITPESVLIQHTSLTAPRLLQAHGNASVTLPEPESKYPIYMTIWDILIQWQKYPCCVLTITVPWNPGTSPFENGVGQ